MSNDTDTVRVLTRLNPLEYYTVAADLGPPGHMRLNYLDNGEFLIPPEIVASFGHPDHQHPPFPDQLSDIFRRFERLRVSRTRWLSANRTQRIGAWALAYEQCRWVTARGEALRRSIQSDGPAGPDCLSTEAIFDESRTRPNLSANFHIRDLVNAADVILGVDVSCGRKSVVFGAPALEAAARSAGETALPDLRAELDQGMDEPERLAALVQVVRAGTTYRRTNAGDK